MDKIIVRENKPLRFVIVLLIVAAIILLPFVVYSDLRGNKAAVYGYVMAAVLLTGGLVLLLDYRLRRFTIDRDICCYRPRP